MENFQPQKNNEFEKDKKNDIIFNKNLATDEDKEIIKYQDFSKYGNVDNDAINDTDPQQNTLQDIAMRNLDKIDRERNVLNQEVVQNELEAFAEIARETLPMLQEHLKYQMMQLDKLDALITSYSNREERLRNAKVGIVGNGHKNLGDKDKMIERTSEGFDNLLNQYEALADYVEKIRGKVIYLNMMGYESPEVDISNN